VPQGGPKFGGSVNVEAILDHPTNSTSMTAAAWIWPSWAWLRRTRTATSTSPSSAPGSRAAAGFVNITQNAKKVFFCGTFTAGGIKTHVEDGKLVMTRRAGSRR
jgi:propionate CoA-transferase